MNGTATVDIALRLLGWATDAAIRAQQERAEIRRLAEQAGVTVADLDAADARFAKHYDFGATDKG